MRLNKGQCEDNNVTIIEMFLQNILLGVQRRDYIMKALQETNLKSWMINNLFSVLLHKKKKKTTHTQPCQALLKMFKPALNTKDLEPSKQVPHVAH